MWKIYTRFIFTLIFIFIISYGIHIRVHGLQERQGYSGGDVFNFLYASRALLEFDYPLDERRLPFFPLILTPVAYSHNALDYAKTVSLLAGFGTMFLTIIFTYRLTKSKLAMFTAAFLSSFNTVLIIASIRPLADSLFIFQTLLSLFLAYEFYSNKKTLKRTIVFGFVLGITALTRFEGMLSGFIIISLLFLFGKDFRKDSFKVGITAFTVMLPWFIRNTLAFGNPLFSTYLQEADNGYGTTTFGLLKERMLEGLNNLLIIFFEWNIIDVKAAAHISLTFQLNFAEKYMHLSNLFPGVVLGIIGLSFFVSLCIGAFYFIRKWKLYGFIFVITPFALYALANWWTPRGRFYASQLPMFIMLASAGFSITAHFFIKKLKKMHWIVYILIAFSFIRILLVLDKANDERIQAEGIGTRDTNAFIEAAKYVGSFDKKTYALGLPHNYDLLFYKKDVIFIPKNDQKQIECESKQCNFYVINNKKIQNTMYNNTKLSLLKSFYQPNSNQHILIYTND